MGKKILLKDPYSGPGSLANPGASMCVHKALPGWPAENTLHYWKCYEGAGEDRYWTLVRESGGYGYTVRAYENMNMCWRLQGTDQSLSNGRRIVLGDCNPGPSLFRTLFPQGSASVAGAPANSVFQIAAANPSNIHLPSSFCVHKAYDSNSQNGNYLHLWACGASSGLRNEVFLFVDAMVE
ncbi:MAG: hypothetical protein U0002_18880 [Thermoanaerobaculia bacterium]